MLSKRKSMFLMFTLCYLVLLGVTNAVLFNVALPRITEELHAHAERVSWIVIGYTMMIAIGANTYGNLADRFSLKRLLLVGIGLFLAGSVLGSVAHQFGLILTARLLQSGGGSSFIALSMIAASRLIHPDKRPLALTLISSAIALGSGTGLLVGGFMTQMFGWHSLFLLMFIVVLAFISLLIIMPKDAKEHGTPARKNIHPFDTFGALLTSAFIITLLLGINMRLYLLVLSAALLVAILYWMPRAAQPFIRMDLLKNTSYLRMLVIGFINNMTVVAAVFLLPQRLSQNMNNSMSMIGVVLFTGAMFSFLTTFAGGKVAAKVSSTSLTVIASLLSLAGYLVLGLVSSTGLTATLLPLIAVYIGYAALQVSLNIMVPDTIQAKEHMGAGLGLYNQVNFVGMAFGPALAGRILEISAHDYSFILILLGALFIVPILIACAKKDGVHKADACSRPEAGPEKLRENRRMIRFPGR
ncbi:MFS transporter [Paenibacillus caui]|uniref:MFS transporter n=1 Tax=Paenibacillus caui TaxID=2873927 RepID=UPI001CA92F17|nr:MFS transporter [Paenibacillus caui]